MLRTTLLRHDRSIRMLAIGMARANRPVVHDYDCPRCGERCRDRAELVAHEEQHRINEREAA